MDFSNLAYDLEHQGECYLLDESAQSTNGSRPQQASIVTSLNSKISSTRSVVQIPPKVPSILFSLAGAPSKKRKVSGSVTSSSTANPTANDTAQLKVEPTSVDIDREENGDRKPGGRRCFNYSCCTFHYVIIHLRLFFILGSEIGSMQKHPEVARKSC